ncbi:MAG: two-component system chemotaxis response regulator CheB [Hydrogenophaga sp.]
MTTPRRIGNEFPEIPHVDEKFPGGLRGWFRRGLDAYTRLLQNLPPDMGVAVVIVNHIIPSNRDLHVDGEVFKLQPISKPRGWPDVIMVFLKSLTQFWDGKLIAGIVSGIDGDGAEALRGIKAVGGITMAQTLDTASHPYMPQTAIASGCIDFILSPEGIATEIMRIAHEEAAITADKRATLGL